jgi:hypothetical protein
MDRTGPPTKEHKETPMKLTRVILLALAFAIPFASTTLASAADEPAADTAKPAKKKGKKAKKAEKKAGAEEEAK